MKIECNIGLGNRLLVLWIAIAISSFFAGSKVSAKELTASEFMDSVFMANYKPNPFPLDTKQIETLKSQFKKKAKKCNPVKVLEI